MDAIHVFLRQTRGLVNYVYPLLVEATIGSKINVAIAQQRNSTGVNWL